MAVRKTVTVLFSDIVGSTGLGESLDAEVFRGVLGRYFGEVRPVLERHGGRVEKFIGDAVVALFGVPTAREDDALRALRAAVEIRERLELLNVDLERDLGFRLAIRTGVATGEVVVEEESADGTTASGDTMNVAARLEQAARADEILIGARTRQLGGAAIVVEDVEPLPLKGKAEPVVAFRLVRVLPDVSPYARRDDAPFVGRRRELELLRESLGRVLENRECALATVVGAAGVGKSRLIREFLAGLDDSVHALVGRCAPYGEGITFLPLAEALSPVLGPDPRSGVLALLAGGERADLVADQVAAALGAAHEDGSADETFWAFRRMFEAVARETPVVLVVDDVHWAEPTLLDLLEYVAAFSTGAAILIVCLTRPELLEVRPTWTAPRDNAAVAVLAPLGDDDAVALVESLLAERTLEADELRRILDAADGNPLFLEQLLALNADAVLGEELVVPPTIHALLAARLDQLDEGERLVLGRAAIEGREFHRRAVVELLPEEARGDVGSRLLSLARRQFIRPLPTEAPNDDAFAFAHALVRDTAYAETPKRVRAELHVRLADYLERDPGAPLEIVGHHFAEAARYRLELGLGDEATQAIAARAADLLGTGGRRALDRGDDRAAAKLLERAAELVPIDDSLGLTVRSELGRALSGTGELEQARAVFVGVRDSARDVGELALELRAELGLANLRVQTDPRMSNAELAAVAEHARPVFEAHGDEYGLARSWFLVHWAQFRAGRYAESMEAAEKVIRHSSKAGDTREQLRALGAIAMAHLWGSTPVVEVEWRLDELLERSGGARLMEAFAHRVRGGLCSLSGDFERGREHCRSAVEIYRELGHRLSALGVVVELQRVERKAGRLDVAERELRSAYAHAQELGDVGYVTWVAVSLVRVLAEQGKLGEAVELARVRREELQSDIAYAQIVVCLVDAASSAASSKAADAEVHALEALTLVEDTDILDLHGDVLLAVAELDQAAGRAEMARVRVGKALELYEQKGDVVSAARARARLAVA